MLSITRWSQVQLTGRQRILNSASAINFGKIDSYKYTGSAIIWQNHPYYKLSNKCYYSTTQTNAETKIGSDSNSTSNSNNKDNNEQRQKQKQQEKSKGGYWTSGWRKWAITTIALGSGYSIGAWNFNHFGPKRTQEDIEKELDTIPEYHFIYHHPYLKELRRAHIEGENGVLQNKYKESRYYDAIPLLHRGHMLTSGLLKGEGYLTVEPVMFQDKKNGELVIFYHIGNKLDGHDGIVHGGFLATLMDEGLTRCGFPLLPNKYGVTGSLNMNYRAPTPSNSYIMLKGKVDSVNGRRVIAKGRLETVPDYDTDEKTGEIKIKGDSKLLVEGEMLIVEPRWAKYFLWMIK